MTLEVENKSILDITIKSAYGALHDADTGAFLKNVR